MLKDLVTDARKTHHLGPEGRFELAEFEASWRKMGSNTNQPVTDDPKAAGLGLAKPNAFILQQVAPGAGRIRIVGQQLHDILAMEPRGMSFGGLFAEGSRENALELMDAAFTLPAIVSIPLIAPRGPLRRAIKAEVLLLPLWTPSRATKHLMGALVLDRPQNIGRLEFSISKEAPFRCDALDHPVPDRRRSPSALKLVVNNKKAR